MAREEKGTREGAGVGGTQIIDRLVHINRVAKVVKGGRRFGFSALVVAGDERGRAGFGKGKARDVPEAIRKATEQAKTRMIRVPLRGPGGRTLHHDIEGRHGAGRVVLRTARRGTGIIAGGPMRAVFEVLGVQDVVAKSIGSANPYNMVRATFDGLQRQDSPGGVAARRGKKPGEIAARRDVRRKPTVESVKKADSPKQTESTKKAESTRPAESSKKAESTEKTAPPKNVESAGEAESAKGAEPASEVESTNQ